MGIFTNLISVTTSTADSAYHYVLSKSAWEYTKAGFTATGRLTKGLVVDGLSTAKLAFVSLLASAPAGTKAVWDGTKALFWDLPKAGYYKYHGNTVETGAALQQTSEDLSKAGQEFVEAASTGASTAYQGIKPIVSDIATCIAYHGGEAVLDTAAVVSIGLIESGKAATHYVAVPLACRLGSVASALGEMTLHQANQVYGALPSFQSFLPRFTSKMHGEENQAPGPMEFEIAVRNVLSVLNA